MNGKIINSNLEKVRNKNEEAVNENSLKVDHTRLLIFSLLFLVNKFNYKSNSPR